MEDGEVPHCDLCELSGKSVGIAKHRSSVTCRKRALHLKKIFAQKVQDVAKRLKLTVDDKEIMTGVSEFRYLRRVTKKDNSDGTTRSTNLKRARGKRAKLG